MRFGLPALLLQDGAVNSFLCDALFPVQGAPSWLIEACPLAVTWRDLPVHGLAVGLETPAGGVFLIDTGGAAPAGQNGDPRGYDAGRDTIAPFLAARGHTERDGMGLSHPHGDHFGGAWWRREDWTVHAFVDDGYTCRGPTGAYRKIRARAKPAAAQTPEAVTAAPDGGARAPWR